MTKKNNAKYTSEQVAIITGTHFRFVSVLRAQLRSVGVVSAGPKARADFQIIVFTLIARDLATVGVPMSSIAQAMAMTKGCETKATVAVTKPGDEDKPIAGIVIDYPAAVRAAKKALVERGGEHWLPDEHKPTPEPTPEAEAEPEAEPWPSPLE